MNYETLNVCPMCTHAALHYMYIYHIAVKPVVHLNVSQSVAKSGSSVTVTCTAESYPAPDNASDFKLKHPLNTPISGEYLPGMNGIVHTIDRADSGDSGQYKCIVTVTRDGYNLQSEAKLVLTVYGELNDDHYRCL